MDDLTIRQLFLDSLLVDEDIDADGNALTGQKREPCQDIGHGRNKNNRTYADQLLLAEVDLLLKTPARGRDEYGLPARKLLIE